MIGWQLYRHPPSKLTIPVWTQQVQQDSIPQIDIRDQPIDASVWSGATHEETGLQRNGTKSTLAMNPDSILAVMTIVCRDPVGGIAYNIRSTLALIRSTMTAQRFIHDILRPNVLPLMQQLPGAIFQQDYARPHAARV
ncbi:transposable element Tcb2 transposase [Trichonephila clavipes]|nr:transposable element Tcb2 transposase [Trichonephila clavipes]